MPTTMKLAQQHSSAALSARNGNISALPSVRAALRPQRSSRASSVVVRATASNPVRQVLTAVVSNIYKANAAFSPPESGLSPLWAAIKRLDLAGVEDAIRKGANVDERDANGDTPLLYIARAGHYKYLPNEIPQALVKAGADLEACDKNGLTALQVSLLAGWQNIAELLLKSKARTGGVPEINGRVTCPDCKRLIAEYSLA